MSSTSELNSGSQLVHQFASAPQLLGVPVEAHAAEASHAAQEAVAGELFVHAAARVP